MSAHIQLSGTGDALVIKFLLQKMDTNASTEVEKDVMDAIAANQGRKIAFDMALVTYVASSFLRICLKAAKHAGPGHLSFLNLDPSVKKVFKIAGFDILVD
jgi:anti-anti-sigma factor